MIDIFLPLVNNIAILVSLSIVHGLIMRRWKQGTPTYQVLSGLLFGGVTIIGMMNPLKLMPGIIFDGRSIIISIAGLFGGPVTGVVTACISGAYRLWLGGAGAIMGVSVITESALVGIAFHYLRKRRPAAVHPLCLLAFGVVVHLIMIALTIALPARSTKEVFYLIAIPVITIYPIATLLVCMLFLDQESRVKAEAKLQEQYALLNGVLEGTTDGIFVKDLHGRYLAVNPMTQKIIGHPLNEILGHDDSEVFPPDIARELMSADRDIMATAQPRLIEETLPVEGVPRQLLVNKTVLRDAAGRVTGVIGVARDITERKVMEEQLRHAQKLDSVGRLAGGVAHDFNNMLSVIIGHVDLALRRVDADSPVREDLREISLAAERSADLTRQLLAFARRQTARPQVLNLNDCISNIQAMLKRLIGENIALACTAAPELWPILMDPSQVDQVLTNLVINARDAIADVGIVTIETRNTEFTEAPGNAPAGVAYGQYVVLTVADTGSGMDDDTIKHVFEPFYTTKEIGKGTGLGLATIYGIVKQNQGFIDVSSKPGKGTKITVYLPRTTVEPAPAPQPPAQHPLPRGTETILLVEDEAAILRISKTILEQCGYTVLAAPSPELAIEMAEGYTEKIDLLVTDVVMPGMNGKELRERLTAARPGLRCLYMSGYTADAIAQHGVLDEGLHFVQKPFTVSTLTTQIREVLAE